MYKKRRHNFYSDWFKATAVELGALPGVHAQDVAGVLDVHPVMLYRWKKQYQDGEIMKKPFNKKAQLREADFWGKIKKRTDDPGKTCLK